jgi:hypothetical protein
MSIPYFYAFGEGVGCGSFYCAFTLPSFDMIQNGHGCKWDNRNHIGHFEWMFFMEIF